MTSLILLILVPSSALFTSLRFRVKNLIHEISFLIVLKYLEIVFDVSKLVESAPCVNIFVNE